MSATIRTKVVGGVLAVLLAGTAGGGLVAGAAAGLATDAIAARVLTLARAQGGQAVTVNTALAAPAVTAVVNTAATNPAAAGADSLQTAVESVYAQADPSVVYIVVSAGGRGGQASGSGFVYDQNGMIVTNAHVVDGAQTIEVVFADGSHQSAKLVGEDTANDLAVIQVSKLPASAKPLTLAADNSVQVGEFVAAIGSPFGEQNSMSFGIVSGLNRSMLSSSSSRFARNSIGSALNSLIQTDAPINPGNSGGPLLDLNGQVVGVDNAIESSSGSNAGVGFAIPVSVLRQVVPGLIANAG
jgi:S1-C subfamily serine protease